MPSTGLAGLSVAALGWRARSSRPLGSILAEAMARGQVARNVVHEASRGDRRRARVEKRHTRKLQVGVDLPTKDELRAMLEHAGRLRPLYGLHSLRHAAASMFIELGWSPKRVQVLLGHSTIAMTLDTYTHLFPTAGGRPGGDEPITGALDRVEPFPRQQANSE
jgi:hypothetical protein